MEMHNVANLATLQTPFFVIFSLQKSAQTLFSLRESPVLPREREVLPSHHAPRAHISLSLSVCLLGFCSARGREEQRFNSVKY